ncbi:MAG: DUF6935 domain-containing protein [Candidatus Thorarchaeota archaeon]|jgi:hypothetical protein
MAKKITKPLITSFSKFKSAWEKDAGKPENTLMYANSPSGLKLGRSSSYYVTKFLESPNSVRSYLGGSNENDYKIDKKALTLTVTKQVDHGKGVKIFVHSGGRDMPVPAQLKKNSSGQWKLTEYSSFCMTVKKTKTEEEDF